MKKLWESFKAMCKKVYESVVKATKVVADYTWKFIKKLVTHFPVQLLKILGMGLAAYVALIIVSLAIEFIIIFIVAFALIVLITEQLEYDNTPKDVVDNIKKAGSNIYEMFQ